MSEKKRGRDFLFALARKDGWIIMQNMNRRFFHGKITPVDVAQSLLAEFNRSNLHAQTFGASDKMFVQIATRPGAPSGGQTALTVTIEDAPDGVMVQLDSTPGWAPRPAWAGAR